MSKVRTTKRNKVGKNKEWPVLEEVIRNRGYNGCSTVSYQYRAIPLAEDKCVILDSVY